MAIPLLHLLGGKPVFMLQEKQSERDNLFVTSYRWKSILRIKNWSQDFHTKQLPLLAFQHKLYIWPDGSAGPFLSMLIIAAVQCWLPITAVEEHSHFVLETVWPFLKWFRTISYGKMIIKSGYIQNLNWHRNSFHTKPSHIRYIA